MNLSGIAVKEFLDKHVYIEKLIVIHDDLDIPFSRVKIKQKGGDGGHRGIKSIINSLNRDDFFRIKIGIGRPENRVEVKDFVLSNFTDQEQEIINNLKIKISNLVIILALTFNINLAYNFLNLSN